MIIDDYDMLRRLQSYNLSSSRSGLRVVSVFNHFLLIDATDGIKIRSNNFRLRLGPPLKVLAITPFKSTI